MEEENPLKPHHCTIPGCEAKFSRPYRLEIHLRKHTGERPFPCTEEGCKKTYTNQWHLRRHKIISHAKSEAENLRCPILGCTKEFPNFTALNLHFRRAHNPNKVSVYICDNCGLKFNKKLQLRKHMLSHRDLQISCVHCSLTFRSIGMCKKHIRNHKTYTCECGDEFYRWTALVKHKKTCSKHRIEYTCKECNKTFTLKRNYKTHLNTHNDERECLECPYEDCERVYCYNRNLQHHIKVYHEKNKKAKPKKQRKKPQKTDSSKPKKTRKDKGSMKRSTALSLTGLELPYEAEKKIILGQEIKVELVRLGNENLQIPESKRNCCQEKETVAEINKQSILVQ